MILYRLRESYAADIAQLVSSGVSIVSGEKRRHALRTSSRHLWVSYDRHICRFYMTGISVGFYMTGISVCVCFFMTSISVCFFMTGISVGSISQAYLWVLYDMRICEFYMTGISVGFI